MTAETSTTTSVDRATAITEDLIERGAPWGSNTSWQIVLVEGVAAAIVGLLVLMKPFGGSSTTLQIVGLILLVAALVTTFQLWRQKVIPERVILTAFRAGSGLTVGLLVLVATFLTPVDDSVTATLAAVVGVGFIVFGLAGIVMTFLGRRHDEPLPLAGLVLNGVLTVAGVVLTFSGAAGSDSVTAVFNLLGIVLIIAGVGLGGYGYLLRQQESSAVPT